MWRSTCATVSATLAVLALLLVCPRAGAEFEVASRTSCLAAPCGADDSGAEGESAAAEDEELDCLDFSLLQTSLHLNRRSSAATRAGAEDDAVPESKPQAAAEAAADSSLSTKSLAPEPSNAAVTLTENIAVVEEALGERPKGPAVVSRMESRRPTSSSSVGALERKLSEPATAASSAAAFATVAATFAGLGIGAESGGGGAGGVVGSQWFSHEPHEGIVTGLLSTMASTGMLRGLTAAFIFRLAFAISVVFFIQLLGIRSSEKARGVGGSGEECGGRLSRSRSPSPGPLPPALRRSARQQQQQQQQRLSALTSGGGGVGPWAEQQDPADVPPDELLILRVDTGTGHEFATGFSASSSSSSATARSDAICSALILGKAHFVVPMEAIRKLSAGQSPVEILGPSSRALLHARLPNFPAGGPNEPGGGDGAGGGALGRWLELTTTPKSRYPHACIGPLVLGSVSREPLQIRGPRSEYYGTLVLVRPGCWQAQRNKRAVLTLSLLPPPSGAASSGGAAPGQGSALSGLRVGAASAAGSGLAIGAVATVALGGVDGQALEVKVAPGIDALLTLLCALAVLLMAPEQIRRGPSVEHAVCC